ncbi:MAG: endo alpha-1,4 polygalactosaminidase, partial [Proteobacteria bacterium]|nr:endo alpha-1,4 polygalactosaminidase [Pseudomonadota bacterium]
VRDATVRELMLARMDLAAQKGCDGVEPDNLDGFESSTGFPLSQVDAIGYAQFLATAAHERKLSIGQKNMPAEAAILEPSFDWALSESCLDYDECAGFHAYITAGKPVFHVEYVDEESEGPAEAEAVCNDADRADFATLIKTWILDAWYLDCSDVVADCEDESANVLQGMPVTTYGSTQGTGESLTDGQSFAEGTDWEERPSLQLDDTEAGAVIELGRLRRLGSMSLQGDCNDDYLVEATTDGETWTAAWAVPRAAEWCGFRTRTTILD